MSASISGNISPSQTPTTLLPSPFPSGYLRPTPSPQVAPSAVSAPPPPPSSFSQTSAFRPPISSLPYPLDSVLFDRPAGDEPVPWSSNHHSRSTSDELAAQTTKKPFAMPVGGDAKTRNAEDPKSKQITAINLAGSSSGESVAK